MLAASPDKAQGILLWNLRMRRRVGCEALQANVQHLMDRSELNWFIVREMRCGMQHGGMVWYGRCL